MTTTRPRPSATTRSALPLVPLAIGAVVVVLAIGLAVALVGGGDDGGSALDADLAAFAPVTVAGTNLPAFTATEDDPAVGAVAPILTGEAPDGTPVTVGGATGEPTLIAFLAHWCPHCQRELPLLVDLAEQGTFEGIRTVAVLTGTNPDAPNFPPAPWLQDEGWTGDVLVDDEATSAAGAYGLAGYPFLVVLDGDGQVVARTSGELPAEDVAALVAAAR